MGKTLSLLTGMLVAATVCAQIDRNITASFQQTPVQKALSDLFGQVGLSYTADSGVDGEVTGSYLNVPFLFALRSVVAQAHCSYKVVGNTVEIVSPPLLDTPAPQLVAIAPQEKAPGSKGARIKAHNQPIAILLKRLAGYYVSVSEAFPPFGSGGGNGEGFESYSSSPVFGGRDGIAGFNNHGFSFPSGGFPSFFGPR